MVFPNSGAMVSDGFDLEKDLKMRIIVTDSILRQLCVLLSIQITLLLVNSRCKKTPSQMEVAPWIADWILMVSVGIR